MEKKTKEETVKEPKNKTKKAEKGLKEILKKTGIGILLCTWACGAFYFINKIISSILVAIIDNNILAQPLWTTVINTIIYAISIAAIILVPAYIYKKWKTNREELGLTELPTFTDIGLSIIGFIVTIITSSIILKIMEGMQFDTSQSQSVGYSHLSMGFERVIAFISLTIITPIAEEIIFRGWLYGKLRNEVKVPVAIAVALVSIAFGVMHGQVNVGVVVGIMSIVACIERELTGTIYAGILTHMIKNGVAFAFLIFQGVI